MAITNAKMIQLLAPHLSKQFNDRIPDIEKANMTQVADVITSYPTIANEFVEVLTNQVIRTMFTTRELTNPLKMFDKGTLSSYGKSLEFINVDLMRGKDFTDRFGGSFEAECLRPEEVANVKVQYLTENSRLKYKVTISTDQLASAFRDEYGLSSLCNQQVAKMYQSYEVDKWLMTWKLLDTMPTTKAICVKPVDHETSKAFARKVKEIILDMGFPTNQFNVAGVYRQSKPSDLYIIIDNFTKSLLDVELLAMSFNMSKVEFESRIITVPYFKDEKRVALIVDKDKIQIYNTKTASDSIRNGAGLFTNVFLHKWDLFGSVYFENCVELRAEDLSSGTPITSYEYKPNSKGLLDSGEMIPSGQEREMPYDRIEYGNKDEFGTVIADMSETILELDSNGEIANKVVKQVEEKKVKTKAKK